MSQALSQSKHVKPLHHLLKPQNPSSILLRFLSDQPSPEPPPPPQNDESKITQAVQLLLQTPHHDWASSQPLQHLLFSSPDPSPRLLYQITRRLVSSSQALDFFNYLQKNSPLRDNEFLSSVFQAVLQVASQEPDSPEKLFELYQSSKEWGVPLTINAAKLLVRCFGRAKMLEKSVLVFNELDPSLKNTYFRNVFIDVLMRDGRVDEALKVLDEMLQQESEAPPDDKTGVIVFYALLKREREGRSLSEEETIALVLKFGKHGVFPSTYWLTRLITKLCRSRKTGKAWDLLHELMELRAPLQAAPFNALLTSLGRHGDVERMNALLKVMKDSDIQPDIVTFGILINMLCKLRRVDEALEVLQKIGKEKGDDGIPVEVDAIIYNTLIDGLCRVGRQEEGLVLMEKMKSQTGCAPTISTYNCLIDGFCKAGEIERAHDLFDQMNKEGLKPDVAILNTLVNGMCRNGRTNAAYQFLNEMQGKGLKGNAATYTALISAFSNVNNIDKAMDLFEEMLKNGCTKDAIVYYSLISGLSQAGRMVDASNALEKLKEAGFSPDLICYNVLIGGFCKKKMLDKAYGLLKEMDEVGLKPDSVTYNILISYFSRTGNFNVAAKLMKQMTKEGLVPNVVTYGALIHGYCSNGKIDEAMKIFSSMSSNSKVAPNTIIYNTLIESLCKIDEVKLALELMDDMKARGVQPNTTTFNATFKGLKENNMLEEALILMDRMAEHACNPDYITMEILIEWLTAAGQTEKLKRFVEGYKASTSTHRTAATECMRFLKNEDTNPLTC